MPHVYTFDAGDTANGTYNAVVTDRATNQTTVPFTVTRDAVAPTLTLIVAGRIAASDIPVQWTAVETGSGIRGYDLEVSADGGASWTRLLTATQATTYTFTGTLGVVYTFRVRATDRVSNVSAWAQAEAKTVVVKKYYSVAGQRVAVRSNGVVHYIHSDHLGSTSLTTNESGNVAAAQKYLPYGEVRWVTGTLPTDLTYTGQRQEDFGLMDYRARFYSSRLGRFLSADTIVPGVGSISLNRYMYVSGSPILRIDPTGHDGPTFAADDFDGIGGDAIGGGGWGNHTYWDVKQWAETEYRNTGGWEEFSAKAFGLNPDVAFAYLETIKRYAVQRWKAPRTRTTARMQKNEYNSSNSPGRPVKANEKIVIFESKPGSGMMKTYEAGGISAQSLTESRTPEQALQNSFRRLPRAGESYWTSTGQQIEQGRGYAYMDGGMYVPEEGMWMPRGHVSIYRSEPYGAMDIAEKVPTKFQCLTGAGTWDIPGLEFHKIWTRYQFPTE